MNVSAAKSFIIPGTEDSNRVKGLRLARFANIAYQAASAEYDDVAFEDLEIAQQTIKRFQPFREDLVEGVLCSDEKSAVVAFAGTSTTEQWVNSLAYGQTTGYGGRVHKGFAKSLDSIWDLFLASVFDMNCGQQPIWFTGHSLGGALATLAAWRAYEEGLSVAGAVTFGAPPIFTVDAAQNFAPSLIRYENEGDVITDLAWPLMQERYIHAGSRVCLLRSGVEKEERYSDHLAARIDRCSRYLDVDDPQPLEYGGFYEDHRLDEYVRRLSKQAA